MTLMGRGNLGQQHGFSLPEVLIAALFFSISLLGLLQYHQALLQGFTTLWQQRQAWLWLHQHIERQGKTEPEEWLTPEVNAGWHYRQFIKRIDGDCREFHFTLITRYKLRAEFSRWFCSVRE